MKRFLRMADVAELSGLTLGTCRVYKSRGWLPEPVKRIGNVQFFDRPTVRAYLEIHNAGKVRPDLRKSVRRKRRAR
jgi:predicted site-specific integrase-resolvase